MALHVWSAGEEITATDLNDSFASRVATTGNETIAGIKTFSSFSITPSAAPTADYEVANKKYVADLDAANVKLTGNQTVAGIKTFSSAPKSSAAASASGELMRYDETVKNTGNETIAGVKTFSSIPVLPASNPTADNEAARKAYVDVRVKGWGTRVNKTVGTVYQAEVDGLVIAYQTGDGGTIITGYADNNNPPTTVRAQQAVSQTIYRSFICFPVLKDEYYKTESSGATFTMYWTPFLY